MTQFISDPVIFFRELGGLHDADMGSITWEIVTRTITLCVDDLNANFKGLPEYGGRRKATIIFKGVEDLLLNCDSIEGDVQRIFSLEGVKKPNPAKYEWVVRISPSGRISFACGSVHITDLS
jgi:hypothetical protein